MRGTLTQTSLNIQIPSRLCDTETPAIRIAPANEVAMTNDIAKMGDAPHKKPITMLDIKSPIPLIVANIPNPVPLIDDGKSVAAVELSSVSQIPMYRPEKQKTTANLINDVSGNINAIAGMTAKQ